MLDASREDIDQPEGTCLKKNSNLVASIEVTASGIAKFLATITTAYLNRIVSEHISTETLGGSGS